MSAVARHSLLGASIAAPFNQTVIQLSTVKVSTQVVPGGSACVSGWQTATGCAIHHHYNEGAACTDKTKEEKPKHMDGYFSFNKLHMLEVRSVQSKDRRQFFSLVMSQ